MQHCFRLQQIITRWNLQKKVDPMRTYLTAASQCTDSWNRRLTQEHIKDAKPLETSYKLVELETKAKIIHAIDLDIFVNCIKPGSLPSIFENLKTVVEKFRICPENHKILSSTNHAILRAMIDEKYIEEIFKLLANPKESGVFIDSHIAKIFMDMSLKEEKYADSAEMAIQVMLQEEFSSPITTDLAILSCLKYLFTEGQEPLRRYKFVESETRDEEEYKVVFIPSNVSDEHFDLTEDRHFIGKTLMYASYYQEDAFIKHSVCILGLSLFEKWSQLEDAMATAKKENISLAMDISSNIELQLASCEDEDRLARLKKLLEDITSTDGEGKSCVDCVDNHLRKMVDQFDVQEIEEQTQLYDKWNQERIEVYNQLQTDFRVQALQAKIDEHKTALQNEENYLHFYDNEDLWLKRGRNKKELLEKKHAYLKKITRKVKTDMNYIIPEMSDMSSLQKTALATKKKVRREGRVYKRFNDIESYIDEKSRRHCGFYLYKHWTAL